MRVYLNALKKRAKVAPVNVAIVGAGWFGRGLVREMVRWPALTPKLFVSRTIEKAVSALMDVGVQREDITLIKSNAELRNAMATDRYIVTSNIELMKDLKGFDLVFEATGDIEVGANTALWSIEQGINFVTVGAEMDATVGVILNEYAKKKNVIYSDSDGDQPGVLAKMIANAKMLGFKIVVAGNGKGFLNYHAVPDDIIKWVRPGHNPRKISSFTDGSKQGLELTVLSNATGLIPGVRGMYGPKVTKETLIEDYLAVIKQEGIVDYMMGTNCNFGMSVFVIAKREHDKTAESLEYYKMGSGPYYLFFQEHHLCEIEAPKSIVDAALFHMATIAPKGKFADVLTVAKKDLKAGTKLDGVGGYTVYGLIDRAEVVKQENLLPLGLSEYAVLRRDVTMDEPITYDMVDFPQDNVVLRLRREQDEL
ncbi:MAG: NAD(P)-dependent oxidoreductase [Phycisphaerae bacterium]|jgi:predicted homoserine dehydrogenase-like protein